MPAFRGQATHTGPLHARLRAAQRHQVDHGVGDPARVTARWTQKSPPVVAVPGVGWGGFCSRGGMRAMMRPSPPGVKPTRTLVLLTPVVEGPHSGPAPPATYGGE